MDLVCLYTNHWFLSFLIILIIISNLGIELSGKAFITSIIVQYLMVQVLWNNYGLNCLNAEKERIRIMESRIARNTGM